MEGFGLKYWITHDPELSTEANTSQSNFVLFFFVTTILIYGIGVTQYALKQLYGKITGGTSTQNFVDLCSVLNISVLMFDETFGGYYIHGSSPYGSTEISTEKLRLALRSEEIGKGQMRGLTLDDPDLQTYKIFVSKRLIMQYKTNYMSTVNAELTNTQQKNAALTSNAVRTFSREPAIPQGFDIGKF